MQKIRAQPTRGFVDPVQSPSAPMDLDSFEFTAWLRGLRHYFAQPDDPIYRLVHKQLEAIVRYVGQEPEHANSTRSTSLVHDFFLKFTADEDSSERDMRRFFNLAATIMREMIVGSARRKIEQRDRVRTADRANPSNRSVDIRCPDQVVRLDGVVDRLYRDRPLVARVFVQRHFARLCPAEIAQAMALPVASVERDLKFANAFVLRNLRTAH